jgi:hypothetical protein
MIVFDTAQPPLPAGTFSEPVKIYTGLLGQIGDIIMFTATARRIKEIFPNSTITFAVSKQYREAGELVAGLPYVDRLFVTEHYYDLRKDITYGPWHYGWPCDYRGEDEIAEQRNHDIVLETRPQHRRMPWWEFDHQVAELAHEVGVPGPIDLRTEIAIPPNTMIPADAAGRIILHNDPNIDSTKAWSWEAVADLVQAVGPKNVVLLGNAGPEVAGVIDLRGKTTLSEAAAVIQACKCYVGIDSGLMWIAGSLQVPVVGLYGTSYIPAYQNIQPANPNAVYLQVEGSPSVILPERVLNALDEVKLKYCS